LSGRGRREGPGGNEMGKLREKGEVQESVRWRECDA
jgi:hypothetical protein